MIRFLLVAALSLIAGCGGGINYIKVPMSQVLSSEPTTIYVQVITEDNDLSNMDEAAQKTKAVEHLKDFKYVRSDEGDYMSYWVPLILGGKGENTKALAIYRENTQSGAGIGLVVNSEWSSQFPRHFMSSGMLIELCNETDEEFVSTSSYNAVYDGWPSTFIRARFSRGKCIKSIVVESFNTPVTQRGVGEQQTSPRLFLLKVESTE